MAANRAAGYYQPKERWGHRSHRIGNNLYLWGGIQTDLPEVHSNEKKKSLSSVVEIFSLQSGQWDSKPTTGEPPLGISGYASAVIDNEVFYFGGYCNHGDCFHNSLISLDIDNLTWREVSLTTAKSGPMMKGYCGMISVHLDDDVYLVVFGGYGPPNNTPQQHGAQYSAAGYNRQRTNEIHYFKCSSGEWISPTVRGDVPPPCYSFTLTSITESTAILFGGFTPTGWTNDVYIAEFTKTSVTWKRMLKPQNQSMKWPKERGYHSSVLISTTSGPHLLVVGGYPTKDSWLLDITAGIWKELTLPLSVTDRQQHSLSVWSVTPSTSWIIQFGGEDGNWSLISDTAVIELTYGDTEWSVETISLDQYQQKLTERIRKWKESLPETERQLHRELRQVKEVQTRLQQELHQSQQQLQESKQKFEESQEQIRGSQERERALDHQLQEATSLLQQTQQANEQLQNDFREAQTTASSFFKQKAVQLSEKDEMIQSLRDKLDEEKKAEKEIREELHQTINDLKHQLQESATSGRCSTDTIKHKEISVQFDYRIPQSDLLQGVHIAAAAQGRLFLLQGDSQQSFNWEQYGFRLHSTQGTLSKSETCEVAVTPIVSDDHFQFPKGTVLVSAVYAISVAKSLLKPLVIELQHCVDLRTTGQTGCLKFVRASLDSKPHQFTVVKGGVFSVGSRYGSIERDKFSTWGIVAEMRPPIDPHPYPEEGEDTSSEQASSPSDTNGDTSSQEQEPEYLEDEQDDSSSLEEEQQQQTESHSSVAGIISSSESSGGEGGADSSDNESSDHHSQAAAATIECTEETNTTLVADDESTTTAAAAAVSDDQQINPTDTMDQSMMKSLEPQPTTGSVNMAAATTSTNNEVSPTDILYTGMMYHEQRGIGQWKTTYTVAKDLNILKEHLKEGLSHAERDIVTSFKFDKPNGTVRLCLDTPPQQSGWTVHPHSKPVQLSQCVIERFSQSPECSSCLFSVYARLQEPNRAEEPLHYTIPLDGVVPKQSICINRSPPVIPLTTTGSPSSSDHMTTSETRRESDENGFRADVAYQVLTTNTALIKSSQICLHSLADKLLENKIINETERGQITDDRCGLTTDQRMDKLLDIVKASVKEDGEDFDLFLQILRQEDTRRANRLVKKLMDSYKSILHQMQ